MWRKPLVELVVAAIAVAAVLSLAGCGGHTGSTGSTGSSSRSASGRFPEALSVQPRSGQTSTAFTFGFRVPDAAGPNSRTQLGYELSVLGPAHAGCLDARTAGVSALTAGARVTVTLDPAQMGGHWCLGAYRARVTETAAPVCAAGMMCAQFIRVVRIVAIGTFRVVAR